MHNEKNDKAKSDLVPPHGGYRSLKSYQAAEIIYGGFTEKLYQTRQQAKRK
jgi:hypothetical protein